MCENENLYYELCVHECHNLTRTRDRLQSPPESRARASKSPHLDAESSSKSQCSLLARNMKERHITWASRPSDTSQSPLRQEQKKKKKSHISSVLGQSQVTIPSVSRNHAEVSPNSVPCGQRQGRIIGSHQEGDVSNKKSQSCMWTGSRLQIKSLRCWPEAYITFTPVGRSQNDIYNPAHVLFLSM